MRPVYRPGVAVAFGARIDLVFLSVVKVLEWQARLAFPQGCIGQRTGAGIGLEWTQIMFKAGDKRDVAHTLLRRQRSKQVVYQRRVDANILRFRVLTHPGSDENMGRCDTSQRAGESGWV